MSIFTLEEMHLENVYMTGSVSSAIFRCFKYPPDGANIMNSKYFITLNLTYFQRPALPYSPLILIQSLKEYLSPVYKASCGTFGAQIRR